jgi:hypothetical protein
MVERSQRGDAGGFLPPVGVVRIVAEEVLSTPAELAARCDFPVFVPTYWPEECGEPVFGLSVSMLGTDYVVRSADDQHKPMLRVMGSPWRPGANWGEEDFRPVEGMPWPTLIRRIRPATSVVVKTPDTRVLLFSSLGRDETLAVARSLESMALGT